MGVKIFLHDDENFLHASSRLELKTTLLEILIFLSFLIDIINANGVVVFDSDTFTIFSVKNFNFVHIFSELNTAKCLKNTVKFLHDDVKFPHDDVKLPHDVSITRCFNF